jgi:hypothetical protein
MSALSTPVKPGASAAARGPRPWPGMLWVTWRQQRGLLISVVALFVAGVAGLVVEGLRIHHDYATLTACHPAAASACQQLSREFTTTDWHEGNGVRVALLAAPVLLAMFAGPPVLAREMETGTFRYAWTQGIGRVRWTVAKLTILGSVLTLAALVLGQLFTWFFAPFMTTQQLTLLSPPVFDARGVVYAAWTLTAFCLGAFTGTLVRRIIPAMALSLIAYAALAVATMFYLRHHYPVSTFWPMQLFECGWLLILCALLIAATIQLVRRHVC